MAAELTVDVNIMPRILFTGDSQTCGCVGAWDYPQMLSWELPLRVFNRAVGGSNTTHLLQEFGGGTATVKQGESVVHGEDVGWYAGPYIGQTVRLGKQQYTLDSIETTDYANRRANLHLTEPAREDFSGMDYSFEAGWRVRVAEVKPQYACFMYTVNDPGWTSEQFKGRLAEITRRCREAGIQPIFLSGVPMMDAAAGGSHPGSVQRVMPRPQDMLEFCTQERLPLGDVFRTLVQLDGQHTAEWVDTIHPTTDGSMPALWALRHILRELGVTANPYYVRGYRAEGKTLPDLREAKLQPIGTSQPRYDKDGRDREAGFNLEARRLRDEYGLLAEADGQTVNSDRPLVLQFGVGDPKKLTAATLQLVTGGQVTVSVFDWQSGSWREIGKGQGKLSLPVAHKEAGPWREGALYVGLSGGPVAVDYAGLKIAGDVKPFVAKAPEQAILWPTPGQFDWSGEGNLLPNGTLQQAQGGAPMGWRALGTGSLYVGNSIVARGSGQFVGDKRADHFEAKGQKFGETARPLDLMQIAAGPEGCTGNFLVCGVPDDERLALRRAAQTPAAVDFEIRRSSGCLAVPGGCAIEARGKDGWEATTGDLKPGTYRVSFFCRVFDPAHMTAKSRPGAVCEVRVSDAAGKLLGEVKDVDCTYLWQRAEVAVKLGKAGAMRVEAKAAEGARVQYTGWRVNAE